MGHVHDESCFGGGTGGGDGGSRPANGVIRCALLPPETLGGTLIVRHAWGVTVVGRRGLSVHVGRETSGPNKGLMSVGARGGKGGGEGLPCTKRKA